MVCAVAALALAAGPASPSTRAQEAPAPLRASGTLAVRVVGPDGDPVRGARVIAWSAGAVAANDVSDVDGRAELPRVRPGRLVVYVDAPAMAVAATPAFDLAAGEHVDLGTVTVTPGVTLVGTVLGDDDRPVVGATVTGSRGRESWNRAWPPASASTDATGRLELPGLAPTGTWLKVVADGYEDHQQAVKFPMDVAGTFEALPLQIGPRLGRVRVELVDSTGRPVVPARRDGESEAEWRQRVVWLPWLTVTERRAPHQRTDVGNSDIVGAGGVVERDVPAGVWRLHLSLRGFEPVPGSRLREGGAAPGDGPVWWDEITVQGGETITVRYRLASVPRGRVAVQARLATGEPVADAWVGMGAARARTDRNGDATLEEIPYGTYDLGLSTDSGYYGEPAPLRVERPVTRVSRTLSPPSGAESRTVRGVVRDADGARVAGAELTFSAPPGAPSLAWMHTETDAEGRFEFEAGVDEGPYLVEIRRGRDLVGTARVSIGPEAFVELDVRVPRTTTGPTAPGGRLDGEIAVAPSYLAYDVTATKWSTEGATVHAQALSDGSFRLQGLTTGRWVVSARPSLCGPSAWEVVRVGDADTAVTLRLPEMVPFGGVLEGRLEDAQAVHVYDPETRECVAQVAIRADGTFGPVLAPRGDMVVHVVRADTWRWPLATLRLDLTGAPLAIPVEPASLSVQVRDSRGRPSDSADPWRWPHVRSPQIFPIGWGPSIRPDANGRIVIDRLSPGKWGVEVRGRRLEVLLEPGSRRAVEITLPDEVPVVVRQSAGTHPPTDIEIVAADAPAWRGWSTWFGRIEESDQAELSVPPGSYRLRAESDYGYEHVVEIEVPGPEVVLPPHPPRGRLGVRIPVLFESDQAVTVTLTPENGGAVIEGERDSDAVAPHPFNQPPDRGIVAFDSVPAGVYAVVATAADGRTFHGTAEVKAFQDNIAYARPRR